MWKSDFGDVMSTMSNSESLDCRHDAHRMTDLFVIEDEPLHV